MWKKCYKDLESTKQYSVWMKIKVEIDKLGKEKLIKLMKHKLRNLKDLYKQAKDNIKKREGLQCFPLLLGLWLDPRYQRCYQFPLQQRLALNTATDNEDTEINICIFLDYSCLSIKRTPFLLSTFSDYFRFFFQAL